MERRSFIQSTLAGLSFAGLPIASRALAQQGLGQQQRSGFLVRSGEARHGEAYALGVGHHECKVSSRDTAGVIAVFESYTHQTDRPVKHLHRGQDEWFYVLEGEYEMHVGEQVWHVGPGDSVFAPRQVPHVWGCVSERPGRLLEYFEPAGTIEEFFRELPRQIARDPSPNAMSELFRRHGMEVLGPRLPIA